MPGKLTNQEQLQSIPDYINGVKRKPAVTTHVVDAAYQDRQDAADDERNMIKDQALKHGHTKTAFEKVPDNMDHANYQRVGSTYSAKE